jgi:mannose-6-phosphate isomerase
MLQGIDILTVEKAKYVEKPWGWERWIAHGTPDFPYAYKEIFIKAPYKTSLQFHVEKQESNRLMQGEAVLHYSEQHIDALKLGLDLERYRNQEYTPEELHELFAPHIAGWLKTIKTRKIVPGEVVNVRPGYIHRIEAVEQDILLNEVSTDHLKDVIRIQDDAKRPHGHIGSEHK